MSERSQRCPGWHTTEMTGCVLAVGHVGPHSTLHGVRFGQPATPEPSADPNVEVLRQIRTLGDRQHQTLLAIETLLADIKDRLASPPVQGQP